ncbi:hypothetical protein V8E36_005913 [Tilletia maclaganii]
MAAPMRSSAGDPEKKALTLELELDGDQDEQLRFLSNNSDGSNRRRWRTRLLAFWKTYGFIFQLLLSIRVMYLYWPWSHSHQLQSFTTFPHPVDAAVPPVHPLAPTPVAPWKPCPGHEAEGFLCSYVKVPKDYTNSSAGHAYIAVNKFPATAQGKDFRGAIYVNPGGPGGSGIQFAYRFAKTFHILLKGQYTVYGFDPRGIGATRPLVDCFGSRRAYELFKAGTALERPFDVAPDTFSPEGRQTLLRQWTEAQALKQAEMEVCTRVMGDELRHMSTSTVVRDISYLNFEAGLGEGHPINFIGYSYGTILGAYLVNMLDASSLGKVIIDGVASAPGWASMPPERWLPSGWMVDTEKAYEWLLRECSEVGPEECPVSKERGEDPKKINDRLMAFFEELYVKPRAIPYGARPGILTSGMARAMLYVSTNSPSAWPLISHLLADAMAGNGTQLYQLAIRPITSPDSEDRTQMDLSRVAVSCGDAPPYHSPAAHPSSKWPIPSPELLLNLTLENFEKWTPHFAASAPSIEPDGGCEWHPASGRTPERFAGPWNNTLTNAPLFVVSNTADPITPRASGEQINKLMGNSSALLLVNQPGHCSLAGVSSCALQAYQDYFLHDKVPAPGTICERDQDDFHRPVLDVASLLAGPGPVGDAGEATVLHEESAMGDIARVANAQWVAMQLSARH